MKEGQIHFIHWKIQLKSTPIELWPYLSDSNKLFKALGSPPVNQTAISRSVPKGFLELAHSQFKSHSVWQEEPYTWEKPFRFGTTRFYKIGLIRRIKFLVDLTPISGGTLVNVKLWLAPKNPFIFPFIKLYVDEYIKWKLKLTLNEYDSCAEFGTLPYEKNRGKKLVKGARARIHNISTQLAEKTRRRRIIDHLVKFITHAEDEDLIRIHPYALAEYWGEKKYAVLNVFLNAAKLDLLTFSWDVCCPNCKAPKHTFKNLKEARTHLFCTDCNIEYKMDFNKNTHLVFTPHPLIRKVSERKYCFGGPALAPHRVLQSFLKIGEEKYINTELTDGTYLFKSHSHKGHLVLHVRKDGIDNISINLFDTDFTGQEATISRSPNISIFNKTSKDIVCFLEKQDWKEEAIYASEVGSSHDFRSMFSGETLNDDEKVTAEDVTMMFTDLMNSTELYLQEGDEFAIGRVMNHFKIIEQIVSEERGGIVKTIGDSVMAVFRDPVSAIKAVERIQQIFTTSSAMRNTFRLKAGIHMGNCTVVNLNNRIDYFGNTVNIAARLVDVAKEKEIVVSQAVFEHPDVQLYLDERKGKLFVKESFEELKGFKNEEFKVKQIRLEPPTLRLVV